MAIVIEGEFGTYRNSSDPDESKAYQEALEALSNQYDSVQNPGGNNAICQGSCTMAEQIAWMSIQEYFYRESSPIIINVTNGTWITYLPDAVLAAGNYVYAGEDSSWNWGNVTAANLGRYLTRQC